VMGVSDIPEFDPVTVAKMASLFTAMVFPIFDATARSVESAVGEGAKVDVAATIPGSAGTKEEASATKVDPRGRVGSTVGMAVGGITEALARGLARGIGHVALRKMSRRAVQAKLGGMSDADIAKNIDLAMRMQDVAEIPGLPEEVFSRAQITPSDAVTRVKGAPVLNMNVPDRGIHLQMMVEEGELTLGGMSRDPGVKGGVKGADDAILAAMGHGEKHGFTEVTLGTPAERATTETTKGGRIVVDRMVEAGLIEVAEKEGGQRFTEFFGEEGNRSFRGMSMEELQATIQAGGQIQPSRGIIQTRPGEILTDTTPLLDEAFRFSASPSLGTPGKVPRGEPGVIAEFSLR
ncbi:hypothetical protein LCGC14_3084220, partial [marine sediment metagenome]